MSPTPKSRPVCQVCAIADSKYKCSRCAIVYCSVPCFKRHGETCGPELENLSSISKSVSDQTVAVESVEDSESGDTLPVPTQLRPLTSLKWPYAPEDSAFPDPLKRDDPKPLQLRHYEAIATSPTIRTVLTSHPQLRALLTSIDQLRGPERERAIQRALGITAVDIQAQARDHVELGEDVIALRELAEAVEASVREGKEGVLGLDWQQ